jgi:hypothetical protein
VRDLFRAAKVRTPEGNEAWGQFLDFHPGSRQYGVYGTAAGVRALVLAGEPPVVAEVAGAADQLKLEWERKTQKQTEKTRYPDPCIAYKAAWLLEALCPDQAQISATPVEAWFKELFARQLPDGGWGDYSCPADTDAHSSSSSPLATAFVIGCLSRYPGFVGDLDRRDKAISRLRQEVAGHPGLDPAVLAIALWALSRLPKPSESECGLARLLRLQLIRHVSHLRKKGVGRSYVFFYAVGDRYHYLHIPVLVVALLALLQHDQRLAYDRNVRLATRAVVERAAREGGLRAEDTSRLSTVDHCWLALLLRRVVEVGDRWQSAPFREAMLDPRACWWKGISGWSALLVTGVSGIWVGQTYGPPYMVVGLGASVLLLGLLVNLFTDWLQLLRR